MQKQLIQNREYGLDILRVLSMLYIIAFYHIDDYAQDILTNRVTTLLVHIALSTFFFISAYVLANKYRNFTNKSDIFHFLKKRLIRIYPLYFLALLLFFMFGIISFESFYTGVFLVNIFLDVYVKTLWFISLIFIFYFLFIFIMYKYSFLRLFLIYFLITTLLYFIHTYYGYISTALFYYMPSFFLGILFSKYDLLKKLSQNKLFLILSFLVPILYIYFNIKVFPLSFIIIIISIPFTYALSQVLNFGNIFIEKLSYASYTMYIFHRLVYKFLLSLWYPSSNSLVILYLLIVGVPLLFALSYYVQLKYDKILTHYIKECK